MRNLYCVSLICQDESWWEVEDELADGAVQYVKLRPMRAEMFLHVQLKGG